MNIFFMANKKADMVNNFALMHNIDDILKPLCNEKATKNYKLVTDSDNDRVSLLDRRFEESFDSYTDALTALTIFMIRPINLLVNIGGLIVHTVANIFYAVIKAILAAVTFEIEMLKNSGESIQVAAINLLTISHLAFFLIPNMCIDLYSLFTRTCVTAKEMLFQNESEVDRKSSYDHEFKI